MTQQVKGVGLEKVSGIPEVQITVNDEQKSEEPDDSGAPGLQGVCLCVGGFFGEYRGHGSLSQLDLERCLVPRYYTGGRGEA